MVPLAEGDCFIPLLLLSAILCVCRVLWCITTVCAWFLYKPNKPNPAPTYKPADNVTFLVYTTCTNAIPKSILQSWLACCVKQVIIVTEETAVDKSFEIMANKLAAEQNELRVIIAPQTDIRQRILEGINASTTDITVFADLKAIWKPYALDWILACFEDSKIGGIDMISAPAHVTDANDDRQGLKDVMKDFYTNMCNIETAASTYIDGGTTTIWESISAYRTFILKDPSFQEAFKHDLWFGKQLQDLVDAHHHIRRWMTLHGWDIQSQICKENALISYSYDQCFTKLMLDYSRSALRSDLLSLFVIRRIWSRHPYTALVMLGRMADPFVLLLISATVFAFLGKQAQQIGSINGYPLPAWTILLAYILWILLSCAIELLPHLIRQPANVVYFPFWIIFTYFIAILKLYSLCTMYATTTSPSNEERYRQDEQDRVIHHSQSHNDISSRPFYIAPYSDPIIDYLVHK